MASTDRVRISRTTSRAYPYAWRCTVPVTSGLVTEECGARSVAASRKGATTAHDLHMDREHTTRALGGQA